MGKSAGAAPDYRGATEESAQASQQAVNQQTLANRPGQTTPWAQTQWTQNPDGTWAQSTGFAGPLAGAAQGVQGQVASNLAQPFSLSGLPEAGTGDSARQQAFGAAYGQAASRLDPMWGQREDAQRTRLLNQGLDENSQAYRTAMENFGRDRNDAYTSALNSAIGQSTAAGDSLFRNNMAARQQSLAERLRQRSLPLEEMQQLSGFLSMPGFNTAGQATPADYFGAAGAEGAWRMQDAQMRNAFWNDLTQGLFGLGSGAMSIFGPKGK